MKQQCALSLSLMFLTALQLSWLGAVRAQPIWPPLVSDLGGYAIAVDAYGNVYVAGTVEYMHPEYDGYSNLDYATVKYDANGNELWARIYNGPVNGDDLASAMAVDVAGNVYVTGSSEGALHRIGGHDTPTWDYATVKYDKDGNELWVARYDEFYDDWAAGIALDSDGNVYVTGTSAGSNGRGDYATVKYDTNGNQLWMARYDGPDNGLDEAFAVTVDSACNVYVAGDSSHSFDEYTTVIKYDKAGNELWVAYDGSDNACKWARAVAVDGSANIYVIGSSFSLETEQDYATVKYDTNGKKQWAARYNGPGNDDDWSRALTVDNLGNVYITGTSAGLHSLNDYATVKYDTNGTQLWLGRHNGRCDSNDEAKAIAVDSEGNVYVTGAETHGSRMSKLFNWFPWKIFQSWTDYSTIKYSRTGDKQWTAKYGGKGRGHSWARAIAVDGKGNVYVTGVSRGPDPSFWYTTVKYGSNGDEKWVARYDPWDNNDD